MTWQGSLRRASFGGVPFGVLGGQLKVGRRNAVHEYPFKDEVWVEDLGRAARRVTLTGFLVENGVYLGGGSGDVIAQRERMIAACESAGQSTLIHPTLGSLNVSLLESNFNERWDQGRVFELSFSFIEAGQRVFPSADASTGDAVRVACTALDAAASTNFLSRVKSALSAGAAVVSMAMSVVGKVVGTITSLARDATNLVNMVASLPGSFGRFVGGITASIGATVQSLIAVGTVARSGVASACSALSSAAASLGLNNADQFAGSAQAVTASLLATCTDPGDAIRMLGGFSSFAPNDPTPNSAVGAAMSTMQDACGDLFRRAAVASVARASADYQPVSFDDAVAVRAQVTSFLDGEIQVAGDQGEDATYNALRTLRAAVVQDLTARGANLSTLVTITSPMPLPSLVVAQRVYRDAARADELVGESNCIHPAFLPTSFKGLSQ